MFPPPYNSHTLFNTRIDSNVNFVLLPRPTDYSYTMSDLGPAEPSQMPSVVAGTNGIGQMFDYPEATPGGPYEVLQQYHSKPGKLRVACVGAGASGLCLAYKMERMMVPGSWELTLFDKNEQFGGTWHENSYPGVACDIPAHLYTFTFDPNPDWSYYFAYGSEIQKYFEGFAERYGSRKYMKLNTKVVECRWEKDVLHASLITTRQTT